MESLNAFSFYLIQRNITLLVQVYKNTVWTTKLMGFYLEINRFLCHTKVSGSIVVNSKHSIIPICISQQIGLAYLTTQRVNGCSVTTRVHVRPCSDESHSTVRGAHSSRPPREHGWLCKHLKLTQASGLGNHNGCKTGVGGQDEYVCIQQGSSTCCEREQKNDFLFYTFVRLIDIQYSTHSMHTMSCK